MKKISVIIPTYNRAAQLTVAIKSVFAQTYQDFEIIVADDGSTDESRQIVNGFNDSRIKWISAKHSGLPGIARNKGIKKANGEWIAFLDSDDEWLPEKLEKQLMLLEQSHCLAASSNAIRILKENRVAGNYFSLNKNYLSFSDLLSTNFIICSSAIIHHSLIDKTIGFPEDESLIVGEDYALWLRISSLTDFVYIDIPLLKYYDCPSESIRRYSVDEKTQRKIILENYIAWASKNNISNEKIENAKNELLKLNELPSIWSKLTKKFRTNK